MWDFSSLISASENLYKYLFIGGFVMIFYAVTYPLERKQSLEIEINTCNQQVQLLNAEIKILSDRVDSFNGANEKVIEGIKRKQIIRSKSKSTIEKSRITQDIITTKKNFENEFGQLEKQQNQLNVKVIILDFNKSKIEIIRSHIRTYYSYSIAFIIVGALMVVLGLIYWVKSNKTSEKLKLKELNRP